MISLDENDFLEEPSFTRKSILATVNEIKVRYPLRIGANIDTTPEGIYWNQTMDFSEADQLIGVVAATNKTYTEEDALVFQILDLNGVALYSKIVPIVAVMYGPGCVKVRKVNEVPTIFFYYYDWDPDVSKYVFFVLIVNSSGEETRKRIWEPDGGTSPNWYYEEINITVPEFAMEVNCNGAIVAMVSVAGENVSGVYQALVVRNSNDWGETWNTSISFNYTEIAPIIPKIKCDSDENFYIMYGKKASLPCTILKSTDDGDSWIIKSVPGTPDLCVTEADMCITGTKIYLILESTSLVGCESYGERHIHTYSSTDGSDSWSKHTNILHPGSALDSILIPNMAANGDVVLAYVRIPAASGTVKMFKSTNGMLTWDDMGYVSSNQSYEDSIWAPEYINNWTYPICTVSSGTIFMMACAGAYIYGTDPSKLGYVKSIDNALTWTNNNIFNIDSVYPIE